MLPDTRRPVPMEIGPPTSQTATTGLPHREGLGRTGRVLQVNPEQPKRAAVVSHVSKGKWADDPDAVADRQEPLDEVLRGLVHEYTREQRDEMAYTA